MLHKLKNRKQEGFTIIEVLIVLAIAGLILLIVFLAVPALQRNAHNTSLKNDVAGILGAASEYTNNNNGATLAGVAVALGANTFYIGGTAANCTAAASTLNCATAKVGTEITTVNTPTATISTAKPAIGTINLYTTAVCSGNTPVAAGATARNFVAYYQLEGGSIQCQAS